MMTTLDGAGINCSVYIIIVKVFLSSFSGFNIYLNEIIMIFLNVLIGGAIGDCQTGKLIKSSLISAFYQFIFIYSSKV